MRIQLTPMVKATFKRNQPYNDLPLLPPATNLETPKVMRKTIAAARALAALNSTLVNLPNPNLFLDTIYLQEAKASSEVENIVTTNDELYISMVTEKKVAYGSAKEVLAYKNALWLGMEEIQKKPFITTNLCIRLVQAIKQNRAGIRNTQGTQLKNPLGEVVYTPPTSEALIRNKLANWEQFIHADSTLDPLLSMAVMHYQFEAIHPFADGNGRTGRILMLLYLKLSGLLEIPAIYLSDYINSNKAAYYQCLRGVTERNDWETFLLYMLDMIKTTAEEGVRLINSITTAIDESTAAIKAKLPKIYSKELVEILFRLPYTKRQHLIDAQIGNPKTAGNYLNTLEAFGFLSSVKVGKEKLYINRHLMQILEAIG